MRDAAGYAGDLAPEQVWERLGSDPRAVLIDVRSHPEWVFVGVPDLSALGCQLVTVSWQLYPSMQRNPAFADQVRAAGVEPSQPVYLLCRSGVRSKAAAQHLTALGFAECYNVRDGFEGQIDAAKRRGVGGWRSAGLPWVQS